MNTHEWELDARDTRIRELEEEVVSLGDRFDAKSRRIRDLEDEVFTLKERLAELTGPGEHVIEFDEYLSWIIQHPLTCRPNLFACPFNKAAMTADQLPEVVPGRYVFDLDEQGLLQIKGAAS